MEGLQWYPWRFFALQLQGGCLSSSTKPSISMTTNMPSADSTIVLFGILKFELALSFIYQILLFKT